MSLIPCRSCGHMIHTSAKRCPGCGARVHRKELIAKIAATTAAIGAGFLLVKLANSQPDVQPTQQSKETTYVAPAAPANEKRVDLSRPFYSKGVGLVCPITALMFNQDDVIELFYKTSLFSFDAIERKLECVEVGDGVPMKGKPTKIDSLMVEVSYCPKVSCATTYFTSKGHLRN